MLFNRKRIYCWIVFAALLFVIHPIQTQAVTYIVQRMTSLATMFYLLSVVLCVKGRLLINGKERWRRMTENAEFKMQNSEERAIPQYSGGQVKSWLLKAAMVLDELFSVKLVDGVQRADRP